MNPHKPGRPVITIDPAIAFGRPQVRGVTTEAIASMVWAGESVTEVADDYGLTREQVLVACWYQAQYGTRAWRRRWGRWVDVAGALLWRREYDQIPDPPDRDEPAPDYDTIPDPPRQEQR